jgi:type II secretory pathway component GspD/PulD (secretin)
MLLMTVVLSWSGALALAQTITYQGHTVDMSQIPADQRARMMSRLPPGAVVSGGPAQPMPVGHPATSEQKPEEKKEGEGGQPADSGTATIKRSDSGGAADPNELKAKPDKDGMVQFSFRNQPWQDVLQWYADVASCSLDWQELPADKLNLITKRRFSLDQTRDMLNRYLLARGFTMLKQGDVLTVVKTDKIDPALVQRVEPDDLEDHMAYDFARVRFDLPDNMDPAKAVEDAKVLLTPTAKVTPLLASKQLMVIDAVSNLRDVRDLLYGERMAEADDIRPELFKIRHRRAEYIADQIMIVLGLDPSSRKTPMELQIEQQRMQLLMQMQGNGKDITNLLRKDGPPVFIAVDRRRNTVAVNAPMKEMEIVKRVVDQFDVPGAPGADEEMAEDELTTKRYQTVSVSADAVVTALKEIANLSPLTQFQSDSKSKTIFATATAADHKTIQGMIDKLDGSGRSLRVIWLSRRSAADQIAGTIQALMAGEKKEEPRRPYYYYSYGYGNQEEESTDAGFRIQADVENNRLIVMATDDEYAEVQKMLEELGVVTSNRGGNPETWRVIEARTPEETAEMLKRLQEAWGGNNPLNINVAPPAQTPKEKPAPAEPAGDVAPADESEDTLTSRSRRTFWLAQYTDAPEPENPGDPGDPDTPEDPAEPGEPKDPDEPETPDETLVAAAEPANDGDDDAEGDSEDPETPPATDDPFAPRNRDKAPAAATRVASGPPINLTVTPDGRIVISSDDPVALDQLEDLMAELSPPQKDFKVYKLKNTDCRDVWYNLKDYFEDELADDEGDNFFRLWNGFDEKNDTATLGKRRKLRFIWDTATNTVLVQNASPAQIQVIDKLVEIYDQPPAADSVRQRRTAIVQVKYSRAQDIATSIKEVYRDLLSSKDKEFQSRDGNQRGQGGGRREVVYRLPGMGDNKSGPVKVAFEGALSIGVDTISNTLIISAEEQIIAEVKGIVAQLDEEAKPDTVVQVHRVTGSLDAEELQQALSTALSRPWPGGKPEGAGGQNGQGGGNRGGGDRGRRRGEGGGGGGDRGRDRRGD